MSSDLNAAIRTRLELVDDPHTSGYDPHFVYDVEMVQAALLAVVKRHSLGSRGNCAECIGFGGTQAYPCETLRDVAKELGIEVPRG